jgi:hypothetical protein
VDVAKIVIASKAKHRVYRGVANLFVEYLKLQADRLLRFARNDVYEPFIGQLRILG